MKLTFEHFKIVWLLAFIMAVVVTIKYANAGAPVAKFSIFPDKAMQAGLDGATVEQNIYVFIPALKLSQWTLSWDPNEDTPDGYRAYYAPSITSPTVKFGPEILHDDPANRMKRESIIGSGVFDEEAVFYKFLSSDIGVSPGDKVCYRLKAYNSGGESGFSEAICAVDPIVSDVAFYLDDPTMSGAPFHRESVAPWDLMGDNAGIPIPFDVSTLAIGDHTLTSVVNYTAGVISAKEEATFTVVKKLPQLPIGMRIEIIMIHED